MSASLAERIERRQSARVSKMATYHANAVAYFRAHGNKAKAAESEQWLRDNGRCRECGRPITPGTAAKYRGVGGDCFAKIQRRAS